MTMAKYITDGKFLAPPHIQLLNKLILDVSAGRIKRLIIMMPPRHGKSEFVSKYFPAWFLDHNPDKRVILASYQAEFAASFTKKCRDIFNNYYKKIFTHKIAYGSNNRYRWGIENHEGGYEAAGVGGSLVGKGADILIIDDPVKNAEQAFSQIYREKTYDWYRSAALTRLEPDGAVILIMTRWHKEDLIGLILKDEPNEWTIVNLPAIATEDDIIGRKKGEALWPKRFPLDKLDGIRKAIGEYWFSALYQQEPIAGEYQVFKNEWLEDNTCKSSDLPDISSCSMIFQVWDTAFKDKDTNDFSVCITGAVYNGKIYIIDMYRNKPDYPELRKVCLQQYEKYKPYAVGIEDAGSGQSLIQDLRKHVGIKIKSLATENKNIRALLTAPIIESGNVIIPNDTPWYAEMYNELVEFPKARHDDIVDAFCMLVLQLYKLMNQNASNTSAHRERRQKRERGNYLSRI